MFEHLTERVRRIMAMASVEAKRLSSDYVRPEHVLFCMLKEGSGTGVKVLEKVGVDLEKLKQELEGKLQTGPKSVPGERLSSTGRTKRIIESALKEAENLGSRHLGTEHMLLGFMHDNEILPYHLLAARGVTIDGLREAIRQVYSPKAKRNTSRPVTLFTGQWADLPLSIVCQKARAFGYDGLELCCWGDHFNVRQALADEDYCKRKWELLNEHNLTCFAISNHLVGQAVCDRIDERHKSILPEQIWQDGEPEGVRQRAAQEMIDTAKAAKKFFDMKPRHEGRKAERHKDNPSVPSSLHASMPSPIVNGFTGSSIWHLLYPFPPVAPGSIDAGFDDFAKRWKPILDAFDESDVTFALEVHPTEIAFDIISTQRALEAIDHHPRFCFNYDPSHLAYQGVDYLGFIHAFADRVAHMHVKDVWWRDSATPSAAAGIFGGHTEFGDPARAWDFRSPGRGKIDFEAIIRLLNHIGYEGPLSVEWEDPMMDREHGAAEAAAFVRKLQFPLSSQAFDAAFEKQ
jgi:sugar phosphate isomerase/epimerase